MKDFFPLFFCCSTDFGKKIPLCSLRGANLSESEAEPDGEDNITELPQAYSGRGNMASQQSAVRLTEVSMLRK